MFSGYGELSVEADPGWELLLDRARQLEELICQLTPDSRERDLALTRLEEAIWWFRSACLRTPREFYYGEKVPLVYDLPQGG